MDLRTQGKNKTTNGLLQQYEYLLLGFLYLLLISVSIIGFKNVFDNKSKELQNEVEFSATQSINETTDLISSRLEISTNNLLFLAKSYSTTDSIQKYKDLFDFNEVKSIAFINNNGEQKYLLNINEVSNNSQALNYPSKQYFTQSTKLNNGEIYVSEIHLATNGEYIIDPPIPETYISTPVFTDNERVGVLIMKINSHILFEEISQDEELIIVDESGFYIHNFDNSKLYGFSNRNADNFFEFQQGFQEAIESDEQSFQSENGYYISRSSNLIDIVNKNISEIESDALISLKLNQPTWISIKEISNPSDSLQIKELRSQLIVSFAALLSVISIVFTLISISIAKRKTSQNILERRNRILTIINDVLQTSLRKEISQTTNYFADFQKDPANQQNIEQLNKPIENTISLLNELRSFSEFTEVKEGTKKETLYGIINKSLSKYPDITNEIIGGSSTLISKAFKEAIDIIITNRVERGGTKDFKFLITDALKGTLVEIHNDGEPIKNNALLKYDTNKQLNYQYISLYIVAKIIAEYGGNVWVEENSTEKSAISIYIPAE
jgi:hypothetical protein